MMTSSTPTIPAARTVRSPTATAFKQVYLHEANLTNTCVISDLFLLKLVVWSPFCCSCHFPASDQRVVVSLVQCSCPFRPYPLRPQVLGSAGVVRAARSPMDVVGLALLPSPLAFRKWVQRGHLLFLQEIYVLQRNLTRLILRRCWNSVLSQLFLNLLQGGWEPKLPQASCLYSSLRVLLLVGSSVNY